ncbi:MAG: redoxin domain-containing protein [Chitinophagaceae bacterium]
MKHLVIVLALAIGINTLSAQTDTLPPYKRFPTVPPIQLLQLDSATTLTKDMLKKHQPLILMFFSPLCDHCKHQMKDMLARMDDLKNYQIVLASYQDMSDIRAFYAEYKLDKYSNIKIGRDTKFSLVPFFKMNVIPYLALYDKNGNLVTTFESNVAVDKILAAFAGK